MRAIYARSEGSVESAYLHRLAWAFGTRQYDKYHNPMCSANSDLSDTYADSEYACESHVHSLSLCNSI